MLNLGKFPTTLQYSALLHNPISHNLQFPSKPHLSVSSRLNSYAVLRKLQRGLCCNALKTKKRGDASSAEMDGPDEFEDDFDDEFLEGEEDDEDEMVIPLKNMKEWLDNKPRGFGEGKVYDTSIEDKLMEEIEQSRKANLNKLKSSPLKPKKETGKQDGGLTHIQDGLRVRLVNLPKKKNIHRDLKLAFNEVSGILDIVPVVSGNEKTRDPVCKGLAFVHFKSHDEAQRFVQNFSVRSMSFGKVQKQIKCEMMSNSKSPKLSRDQPIDVGNHTLQKSIHDWDKDSDTSIETNGSLLDSRDENASSELDDTDETHTSEPQEDYIVRNETSPTSNSNLSEELKESAINSSSSKQDKKLKTKEKKVSSKSKKDKIPKFNVPGSAKRLKMREKEVLTGVFSRYGASDALTGKEQSR